MTWQWAVRRDLQGHKHNSHEKIPDAIPETITENGKPSVKVTVPESPGIYRLYVWVKDGKGHAATANQPFEVR